MLKNGHSNNLQELPIILKHNWRSVINDIGKEEKNFDVLKSSLAILEAIIGINIFLTSRCSLLWAKCTNKKRIYSCAFPDIILSLSNKISRESEPIYPFAVIDFKMPGKMSIFDNSKDTLAKKWSDIIFNVDDQLMKETITAGDSKLIDPVMQIVSYMAWCGAKVGILLGYPKIVWFEIIEIENEKIFNVNVYPILEIKSFKDGMLEILRILKYSTKLEANKKYFREVDI
ncbi:hypothetical protein RFI_32707, partial [Reticulomyxa filosa]